VRRGVKRGGTARRDGRAAQGPGLSATIPRRSVQPWLAIASRRHHPDDPVLDGGAANRPVSASLVDRHSRGIRAGFPVRPHAMWTRLRPTVWVGAPMAEQLSDAGYRQLCELSGNTCAYPGCEFVVTSKEHGLARTRRDAARIVSEARQGPRWRSEVANEERRNLLNHMLLCEEHHTMVDSNLRIYSVGVLVKMKSDHEALVVNQPPGQHRIPIAEEQVRLAVLPVVGVPAAVYAANALKEDFSSTCRAILHRGQRPGRSDLTPFLHVNGKIWAFHDLSRSDGPFAKVVQRNSTTRHEARDMWSTQDGHRRYVHLLDKVLNLDLVQRGLEWDKQSDRYWFPAEAGGRPRLAEVRNETGGLRERVVAHEQIFQSGPPSGLWRHWALECRFESVGDSWALSTRPTYQWTSDGSTPLNVALASGKVSRKLDVIYHAQYLDQVVFWQNWLTRGQPLLVSQIANASLVLSAEAPTTTVVWPTIGDRVFRPSGADEEELQALLEYQKALDLQPDELFSTEPDLVLTTVGSAV